MLHLKVYTFVLFLFFCSAIIEHTNRVIFLEDDDIAAVADGKLSIHRLKRAATDDPSRAIQTLQLELQQIMKGKLSRKAFLVSIFFHESLDADLATKKKVLIGEKY